MDIFTSNFPQPSLRECHVVGGRKDARAGDAEECCEMPSSGRGTATALKNSEPWVPAQDPPKSTAASILAQMRRCSAGPTLSWGSLTLWLQAAVSGVCTHFISWVWSEQAPAIAVTTGSCVGSVARNHIKDSDGTQAMLESVGLQPRGSDAAWVSSVLAVLQLLHLLTATTRHKRGCFDNYTHNKHIFKSHSWYFSQLPITRKSLNNFHLKSEIKNKQTNKQSKQLDTIWCDISIRFWGAFVKTNVKKAN